MKTLLTKNNSGQTGFGVIEIIIVVSVLAVSLFAFLQTEILAVRLLRAERENLEAMLLAQEGLEAVRALRDASWTNHIATLANGTTYYPQIINSKWQLTTTDPGPISNKYTRTLLLAEVRRDGSDRIADTGNPDSGTRKITSRISWGTSQKELTAYLANFRSLLAQQTENKIIFFEDAPTEADLASFPSQNAGNGDPAQTFLTLASPLQVTKLELLLKRITATPSNIYAELRATQTGAVLGTSAVITSSSIANTALTWIEFRFADPVPLAAATTYAIRLRSIPSSTDASSGSAGTLYWGYRQTGLSPYAGGDAYRYVGRLSNPLDGGQILTQYDFGFRVYAKQ